MSEPKLTIKQQISTLTSVAALLQFFDIGFDNSFAEHQGAELLRRFNGYVLLTKPQDWFDYRRCLKNAYCRVQRRLLDRDSPSRSACHGCSSCERR